MMDRLFHSTRPYLAVFTIFLLSLCVACAPQESGEAPAAETPPAEASAETPTDAPAADATEALAAGGPLNIDEMGRGLRGFDAVAYHTAGQALAGDAELTHDWNGVTWLFANEENRAAFAAEPERYAPQNGGYCTFGVVLKKKLDVDPEIFLVEEERLFLFLNPEVKDKFMADKDGNLSLVTNQWPEIAELRPEELDAAGAGG